VFWRAGCGVLGTMALKFNKGDKVKWSWGNGEAEGKVTETFKEKVTRTIKGNEVTRDADDDNPAYMVEQEDGDRALKSESELSKA
jgi:hypothetical protein